MSMAAVIYLVGGVLGIIGIESLAMFLTFVLYVTIGIVMTWAYARYTGQYRDVSLIIDTIAELAYEQVISHHFNHYVMLLLLYYYPITDH